MNSKIKVIYISGLGRSGSTLIDMLLAVSDEVFSLGEIYRYNEMRKDNTLCSCGQDFQDCSFWRNFIEDDLKIINHVNWRYYLAILNYLYNPFSKRINFKKTSDNFQFLDKVRAHLPTGTKYILDSSKEVSRLIELSQDPRIEIYNINIVRDGRGAANSFNSAIEGKKGKNYFISLFKWIAMNVLIFRYLKKSEIRNFNLSYDQFCAAPDKYLLKIAKYLDINIPSNYIEVVRTMDYHNLGGNRAGRKEYRKNFKEIKVDQRWKTQQDWLTRFLATIFVYFFNKKWVYYKEN